MSASITYTEYGVPHVEGDSFHELGRAAGYATAEQHLGLVAERWITLRGERSLIHGPSELVPHTPNPATTNLESDLFWRYLAESDLLRDIVDAPPPLGPSASVRELFTGFANGYNEYLANIPAGGTSDPRFDAETWRRPIDVTDVYRQALHWNLFRSSVALIPQLVAATVADGTPTGPCPELPDESNMVAFGGDATTTGRGLLFANPHWFWTGPDSFREMHLRIPGMLDVYGSVVPGLPLVMSGFNGDIAFAGTSSYSPRFTVYRLDLDVDDPTSYRYDGTTRTMTAHTVTCPVRVDGEMTQVTRVFHRTHHGLLLGGTAYPRDARSAYCMREVGFSIRWIDQQLDVMTAHTAKEADDRSKRYLGVGWRNLVVADKDGDVLYADRTAIPNVTDEQLARATEPVGAVDEDGPRVIVLDGSTAADEWRTDDDAPVTGIIGASRLPALYRRDYVANENDSHWTNHASELLEGYPAMVGGERVPRTLRTRSGLRMITELLHRTGNAVSLAALKAATTEDRVYSADLWKHDVSEACARSGDPDLVAAAGVLRAWDSCETVDSRGAILWRRFFHHFAGASRWTPQECFEAPFDVTDPLHTPAGIDLDARGGVVEAMRHAVADLAGLSLDLSVGEAQYAEKNGERFPVPGGPQEAGQYNAITSRHGWQPGAGYPDVDRGTGFLLWVAFTDQGPVAESVLAYSQSDDPSSPHHADQTALFSTRRTKRVCYTDADIAAARQRQVVL